MARKTREELEEERIRRHKEMLEEKWKGCSPNWVQSLIDLMKESVDISVTKDNFVHLKTDFYSYKVYKFPFFLNLDENMWHYIEQMEEAKFEIETIKIQKREAERREKIRVNALSKLSKEEKEILGL